MNVPPEVVLRVLAFCAVEDLVSASAVCAAWQAASLSDELWQPLAEMTTWDVVVVPDADSTPDDRHTCPEDWGSSPRAFVLAHCAFSRRQRQFQDNRRRLIRQLGDPPSDGRSRKKPQLVFTGLRNVGKTTMLYRLGLMPPSPAYLFAGTVEDYFTVSDLRVTSFALGGEDAPGNVRYCTNPAAVVWLLDASEAARLADAARELHQWLQHMPRPLPLVVLITKVDLPTACRTAQVCRALRLIELRGFEVYVQRCCPLTGAGLDITAQLLQSLVGKPLA